MAESNSTQVRFLDCPQGSTSWHRVRLGIPTASQAHRIVTSRGRPSAAMLGYALDLILERASGRAIEPYENDWMRRGRELEPAARAAYEAETGCSVRQVGFCLLADGRAGCSPDGLVRGTRALVEIKCPSPERQFDVLCGETVPAGHRAQLQFQMLVTRAAWCDYYSYCPGLPALRIRVQRDQRFIAALERQLDRLWGLIERRQRHPAILAMGGT